MSESIPQVDEMAAIACTIEHALKNSIEVVYVAAVVEEVDSESHRKVALCLSLIGDAVRGLEGRKGYWRPKFAASSDQSAGEQEVSSSWHECAFGASALVLRSFSQLHVPPNSILVAMASEGESGAARASHELTRAAGMFPYMAQECRSELPSVEQLRRILVRLPAERERLLSAGSPDRVKSAV